MNNLSEEEKNAIEELRLTIRYINNKGSMFCDNEDKDNIQICLNLIDKQQKEILHWKGQYYLISRKINKPLEDKIKAKIKELENKENLYKEEKRFNEEEIKFNYAKRVLQELLGDE